MSHARSITASGAKANLGEVLSSLATEGPVKITRNGRLVGILSAPKFSAQAASSTRLAALASLYSAGTISWHQIADETGVVFGDLLIELGRQGLRLPQFIAQKRPEQLAVFEEALRQAELSK